jgi:hypothetical protein
MQGVKDVELHVVEGLEERLDELPSRSRANITSLHVSGLLSTSSSGIIRRSPLHGLITICCQSQIIFRDIFAPLVRHIDAQGHLWFQVKLAGMKQEGYLPYLR